MKLFTAVLIVTGLALLLGFMGWSLWSTRGIGFGGAGSTAIMVIIAGGVLCTGLLTGVFMWLAFYSSRKGFDENPKFDNPPAPGERE